MAQIKEQSKIPEEELNKLETRNLIDAEFKSLVIRILDELNGNFNSIKKGQSEMKDTPTEMENNLQGINSRVN